MSATFDLERDVGERLLALLREEGPEQERRFGPAARQAGQALELLKPALVIPTASGPPIVGIFSAVPPGCVLVLAAEEGRAIPYALPLAELPDALAEAEEMFEAAEAEGLVGPGPWRRQTLAARACLERYGRDGQPAPCLVLAFAGAMLAPPGHREWVRKVAAEGVVPALVCLLGRDRYATLLVPLVHGPAWPEAALAEPAGTA